MTKKEVLKAKFGFPVKDAAIDVVLIDAGLTGSDDYTADNLQEIELCLADLIFLILLSPRSVSEGGFSYSAGTIKELSALRSLILRKYGKTDDVGPQATDASNLW